MRGSHAQTGMKPANDLRLAVDIGGTFTDLVLESDQGRLATKVLTTPRAPEEAVIAGIAQLLGEAGRRAVEITLLIHGTTLATNALIERKGARTAFVTTEGFRDILEMGSEKRFEQYDVFMDKPPPLVPRTRRLPVRERIAADGTVLVPLDEAGLRAIAQTLRAAEVEAIAIGFLHGYAHPRHERRAREILAPLLPEATICLASEVCPEIREYERFSTACANAYVQPLMAGYLARLRARLDAIGLAAPMYLMMSGGGVTTLEQAMRFPIRLVESGPSGGVVLAQQIARANGLSHALAFDMGGTTAKICLLDDGEPERARRFEVARMYRDLKGSGLPLRIPVIELVEIGAGGGSIARVDAMKRIAVGPDSAGSEPGPACYARGGTHPTVTDANVALARIDPARFAGGRIALEPARAEAALAREIGGPLELDAPWPAAGVSEIVEENMANAARVHAVERGKVVERYTLIAFGGGAPLHAGRLAEKLGITRILVPVDAGVGSAIGFLAAPIAYEVVRSRRMTLAGLDLAAANALLAELAAEARAVVARGAPDAPLVDARVVDMRYVGQGHELTLSLASGALDAAALVTLRESFETRYRAIYGLHLPDMAIEIVAWSVTITTPAASNARLAAVPRRVAPPPIARRRVYEPARGEMIEMPVYRRADLAPGAQLGGPAAIVEDATTTIVPASFDAAITARGDIVMERRA
jgi:N-methylhydantoinase A